MARRRQSGFDLTRSLPWPLGLALGFLVIAGFLSPNPATQAAVPAFSDSATATIDWAALALGGVGSLVVFIASRAHRQSPAPMSGIGSLRELSSPEFTALVGEALRHSGYAVETADRDDSGADLILRKAGRTELVQCQHWRAREIDAAQVRAMWERTVGHGADAARIVGTGDYTPIAAAFAAGKPIELINGARLVAMIREAQRLRSA
jgi:restriction system protein